jgi:hypothetical protein
MPAQTELQERESTYSTAPTTPKPGLLIGGTVFLAVAALLLVVVAWHWPFTREAVVKSLQRQSGGIVEIGHFRRIYLPLPGCVADQVTFRPAKNAPPFLTIRQLAILGSYPGLFSRHITTIRADGFHLVIVRNGGLSASSPGAAIGTTSDGLTIGQLIADGAELEFLSTEREKPLVFRIPKLVLKHIQDRQALNFQATVELPEPRAEVDVSGKFGPWQSGNAGQTQLSGAYSVRNLDLGSFGGVAGLLGASGNFNGPLERVATDGTIDIPNFEVQSGGHPVHLAAQFDATVNGLHGDVELEAVRAHFRKTTIEGSGSVSGQGVENGKVANFQLSSNHARIEDLLWMFVSNNPPDMAGAITFRSVATLPPESRPFLQRLKLQGEFGISNARYPHPETQRKIDVLSAQARGQADKVEDAEEKLGTPIDPGRVLANLKAKVNLQDGTAQLRDLSFDLPGAAALLNGSYNLESERVDLRGKARINTQLSKATTGVKSVLLKVVQPFMKKSKTKESVVAIHMGGTYRHPTFEAVPVAAK